MKTEKKLFHLQVEDQDERQNLSRPFHTPEIEASAWIHVADLLLRGLFLIG
jgi:hypothetical protein